MDESERKSTTVFFSPLSVELLLRRPHEARLMLLMFRKNTPDFCQKIALFTMPSVNESEKQGDRGSSLQGAASTPKVKVQTVSLWLARI